MNPINPADYAPEEFARQLAERQLRMQAARSVVYYAHSRTGLLTRFLQRMADGIDPTGQKRKETR